MFLQAGGERWSHWHTAAPLRLPECLSTELLMTDTLGTVLPPDKKSLYNVKRAAQSHVHDLSSQYVSRCVRCVFLINISENKDSEKGLQIRIGQLLIIILLMIRILTIILSVNQLISGQKPDNSEYMRFFRSQGC